jgi:hypothetical protein
MNVSNLKTTMQTKSKQAELSFWEAIVATTDEIPSDS